MTRYDRRHWFLAVSLSILAGYVDVIGFIRLGGLFVSFMSGNSTRFAVGVAEGTDVAMRAGAIIALFVFGAAMGAVVARMAGQRRKPAVLAAVSALLTLGAALPNLSIPAMVLAMGVVNAVFLQAGEVSVGVTYMTGALVKLGQGIGNAITGGNRTGWLPHAMLWLGLMTGALLGAYCHAGLMFDALWLPALWSLFLTLFAGLFLPRPSD